MDVLCLSSVGIHGLLRLDSNFCLEKVTRGYAQGQKETSEIQTLLTHIYTCLLYTSDAADEMD